ncbi:MAG: Crp/Fnr family transcriptional regulator [Gemmatimonadota bacterium]|nr:Crp/Fnr family transcriptional regulator [Gemmatimonadota bacterium]
MIPVERLTPLSVFDGVAPRVVAALAVRGREMRFAPDEVIFRAGSEPRGWYIVIEGRVRVVRGSGARQHVVHSEGAGGTLGEVPLFGGGGHPATGIAAEPTVCAVFSHGGIEAAMAECPGVSLLLLKRLALRVSSLVQRLDDRSTRSVQARLAEFLLTRPASPRSKAISIGMTQPALAEELGTVREVVSRELRGMVKLGAIRPLGGGRYERLDVDALRRMTD